MALTWTRHFDPGRPLWRCTLPWCTHGPVALLDSALAGGRTGGHSYLTVAPPALLAARRRSGGSAFLLNLTTWREPDGTIHPDPVIRTWSGDPFAALRDLQAAYAVDAAPDGHPPAGPFTGGLVGWLGYGAAHAIECLPDRLGPDPAEPDLCFLVADQVLATDHATGRTTLSLTGRGPDHGADAAAAHDRWRSVLAAPDPGSAPAAASRAVDVRPSLGQAAYLDAVTRCREHILAGDVFEVCLTRRQETDLTVPPWRLYEVLREANPAPFAAFIDAGGVQVVGASPERFLRLDADRRAESRPIKGTRPRAATAAADDGLRMELAASPKDRSENIMIVDLVRSDLGRVCETGSVAADDILAVESYATVHQLVSTVTGRLRADRDTIDLVRACFPGGSMTGAPKIAAMEIIDAVETAPRGVYSGALGYLDRGGAMDLAIVIRTLVCAGGRVAWGSGGAVTADSDPVGEFAEAEDKARALLAAVAQAR